MTYKTDPKTTKDMVFTSKDVENKLIEILSQSRPFPIAGKNSLLLYGTFGTGKSTYAKIFLNDFECNFGGSDPYIEIIECQKAHKINSIINHCNDIAYYVSFNYSHMHYFIFDEIDNMTNDAQRALKSFLNKKNIVCVLTTNYLDKIDSGVQSRCELINFNAATEAGYIERFKQILTDNQLPMLCDEALCEIVSMHNGDWRQMTSTLIWAANEYKKMTLAA